MATFFIYICDYTMPVRYQPGNIVVRNCKVENAVRLVRYNFGGDAWQFAHPLADIHFEGIEASGICLPVALNGGKAEAGDLPLEFTMSDSTISFAKPQTEVFSLANVRTFSLTNVTVSGVSAPLARVWGSPPEMKLSGIHGVTSEITEGMGKFQCPWWK